MDDVNVDGAREDVEEQLDNASNSQEEGWVAGFCIDDHDNEEDREQDLDENQASNSRGEIWSSVFCIAGQKKDSKLYIDDDTGYVYRIKSSDKWLNYMVCRHKKCSGIAKMTNGDDRHICQTRAHTHEPNSSHAAQRAFREELYSRAQTESKPLSEIHREVSERVTDEAVLREMTFSNLESSMLRHRNNVFPPIPKSLEDLGRTLEDPQYKNRFGDTKDGKPYFRVCKTGTAREGTIAVFISGHLEHLLTSSECFHIDGHFKTTPSVKDCYQLITIMAVAYDHVFPVVSALMTRKTKEAYKMLFKSVKELCPGIRMPHIMSDFEKGLCGALREEFPETTLTGCLFHVDQAMCKKSAKLGLRPLLQENQAAGEVVRMCMALPFLPHDKIDNGFKEVKEHSELQEFHEEVKPFLEYVDKTWIKGVGAKHLSVYRRHRRTNNDQESYHRTLVDMVGSPHPNAWCWIEAFRSHEAHHWRRYLSVSAGFSVTRCQKKKYRLLNKNIRNLSQKVHDMPVLQFLRAASYHCKETYKRVALTEEAVGDVLEAEDVATELLGEPEPLDAEDEDEAATAGTSLRGARGRGLTGRTRGGRAPHAAR
ncbi:uncharacterized protein LOC117647909, partial [Thrips palmi]|uniref:Uncharacterized protein LOC117647909 n=1 Tax=Thrips palmi TaxID=161013 RepID=A0A6P8Z6E7_THRPL